LSTARLNKHLQANVDDNHQEASANLVDAFLFASTSAVTQRQPKVTSNINGKESLFFGNGCRVE